MAMEEGWAELVASHIQMRELLKVLTRRQLSQLVAMQAQ